MLHLFESLHKMRLEIKGYLGSSTDFLLKIRLQGVNMLINLSPAYNLCQYYLLNI